MWIISYTQKARSISYTYECIRHKLDRYFNKSTLKQCNLPRSKAKDVQWSIKVFVYIELTILLNLDMTSCNAFPARVLEFCHYMVDLHRVCCPSVLRRSR